MTECKSQADLARKLGKCKSNMHYVINGDHNATEEDAKIIGKELGTDWRMWAESDGARFREGIFKSIMLRRNFSDMITRTIVDLQKLEKPMKQK